MFSNEAPLEGSGAGMVTSLRPIPPSAIKNSSYSDQHSGRRGSSAWRRSATLRGRRRWFYWWKAGAPHSPGLQPGASALETRHWKCRSCRQV
jgi:hypothetical protein